MLGSRSMTSDALRAPLRYPSTLSCDMSIALDAQHVRALRLRGINAKEAFTIGDADGRYFRASLRSLEGSSGEALVYESLPTSPESSASISLFCAVLGRQKMLSVIQKVTELGVTRVLPLISERSVQAEGLEHEKAHAWPAQALRATRQCRRASVPLISETVPLAVALSDADVARADVRVHLDDRAAPAPHTRSSFGPRVKVVFVVGPEGGFTDQERSDLDAAGFAAMRLGGRVLRAETAALVGLTLLQYEYGDLRTR